MLKKLLFAAALLALSTPASAVVMGGLDWSPAGTDLTLGGVPAGNQPQNNPCIICGANQPNQTNTALDFGYTDYGNTGNDATYAFFSSGNLRDQLLAQDTISAVNYTGAQLIAVVTAINALAGSVESSGFLIGIDVNQANGQGAQTLESFWFLDLTSQTVVASFLPGINDGIELPSLNNGTGFPDYTLGTLSTAGLDPTHQYAFFARITGANDGPDSFFLVAGDAQPPVPEPATWLMMILGFIGVGAYAHRRSKALQPA